MKIAIIGYSGGGKSTLAGALRKEAVGSSGETTEVSYIGSVWEKPIAT